MTRGRRICALADQHGIALSLRAEPNARKTGLKQEELVAWLPAGWICRRVQQHDSLPTRSRWQHMTVFIVGAGYPRARQFVFSPRRKSLARRRCRPLNLFFR